ncbi:hypothetical protein PFISCL1PPCAC_7779, partial [Pristionchus fissidentatus]
ICTAFACPSGYDVIFDGVCTQNIGYMSFTDAKNKCQNGHLPIVRNEKDQSRLVQFVTGYPTVWIDLKCDGEKFVWSDGTEANYTNFKVAKKSTLSSDPLCPHALSLYYFFRRHWNANLKKKSQPVTSGRCSSFSSPSLIIDTITDRRRDERRRKGR